MTEIDTAQGHPVEDIVNRLSEIAEQETVTLRQLVEAFGTASFVPALMVPALLVVSPLSGIPVFSSVCGLTIALIALQHLFSRDHLWLPEFLMKRTLKGHQLRDAMNHIRKIAAWIDRHSKDRLKLLTRKPGVYVPRALAVLCGAAMPFLELVPFSSSILGAATLLFAVSFLARDGVYALAGIAVMTVAASVPAFVLNSVFGS
ncbi:exopolysaccharide biosynthesis protein [Histidinibacterium aquaticum]|uniref:Exopolysaccharide biosynthesis protein n=1 Tax=Histidinibacterium aquaticum TaxID=2613962 RepID=A0A5J5GBA5_9RHOB|nr:exopolysaccharide biosynthesis protein [Histidinibacterium aquaticum]KAA9005281.1 exopolysaccharide biosynthesis protein [Histidinibacterium aquaticum]